MNFIRPDFLFSYWVFLWFIIYYFFPTGNSFANFKLKYSPKLALFCALAENLFEFVSFILFNRPFCDIFKFLEMIAVVKLIPLYLLRKEPIHLQQDIRVLISVFAAYMIYLAAWGTNVVKVYSETEHSLKTGQNNTPLFAFLRFIGK